MARLPPIVIPRQDRGPADGHHAAHLRLHRFPQSVLGAAHLHRREKNRIRKLRKTLGLPADADLRGEKEARLRRMDRDAGLTDGKELDIKVLVLGDMLEMGPQSPQLHASLLGPVLRIGAKRIFLVGEAMRALADELRRHGESDRDAPTVTHMPTTAEITDEVLAALAYGHAVMVKGSNGVRLSHLVQKIRERFENA